MDKNSKLNNEDLNEVSGGVVENSDFNEDVEKIKTMVSYCKYDNAYFFYEKVEDGSGFYKDANGFVQCTLITCSKCHKTTYWPKAYPGKYLGNDNDLYDPPYSN